ncbi:MAG TPA: hypothetical protein VNT79_18355 [Phycisphaerae bacterium]|nr:hypothetical protein [Phycisphaerae bacterium]
MLKADRDRLAAGESLILTIRVEVEEGVRVQAPKIEGILGQFEVKRSTERQPACPDQKSCIEWQLTLECVMPGIATIPALPFAFEDPREKADGSTEVYRDELATEPIEITVEGGLADVKGPVTVPIPFQYQLLWWGLGVLGAVALIAMLARRFAKRASAASELSAEIAEPAHVWALRELERVAADKLLERGRIKEYFYRIDAILRGYVERRFGLMAAEQTSEEFVRALQDADVLDEDQKAVLQRFVAACDPVKYAKQRPSEDSIAWIGSCARDFVLQTMQTHTDDNAKHTASPTDRSATAEARR